MTAARLAEGAERDQVLNAFNAAADDGVPASTAPERFSTVAANAPASLAVVSAHGSLTYAELDRRSNRLARRLQQLGVRADVTVALCLDRTPQLIVALLAILKAG